MKRLLLVILVLCEMVSYAQHNNFVYVRFDKDQGSAQVVLDAIEDIVKRSNGKYVIYYSNGQTPFICNKQEDLSKLRDMISAQLVSPDFFSETDLFRVNELLEEYCAESVDLKSMKIVGDNDLSWTISFILSEDMLSNANESDIVLRLISINNIEDRFKVRILSYNSLETTSLESSQLQHAKIINYNN